MLEQNRTVPLLRGSEILQDPVKTRFRVQSLADGSRTVDVLRGRSAILKVQPALVRLAARSGQAGEADTLAHFLSTPDALKKTPRLLLIRQDASRRGDGTADDDVAGAVLLFEYRAGASGLRVFSTSDSTGRRSVLAPPELRVQVAALAAHSMIQHGAHLVHIAFCETHHSSATPVCVNGSAGHCSREPTRSVDVGQAERTIASEYKKIAPGCDADWALLEREVSCYLPLLSSYDATLARIGQRTRSNLRYYRRRSEADLGCVFVPRVELTRKEFLEFNRRCTYAVPDAQAAERYETLKRLGNGMLRGVRDGQGEWLSLVGMRRQHGFAEIDWQMNRTDRPTYSLGIVMRSYVIEQEIAEGSTRLYIEGGTPHPITKSFLKERVGELTVKRRSGYMKLLERLAPVLCPPKNYLAQTLRSPELQWRAW